MQKDSITYLRYLNGKITVAKNRNKHSVYFPNESLTEEVVRAVEAEFRDNYEVEIRKCRSCTNTYDVMISWQRN